MQIQILDPLSMLGALNGMSRALDRNDFKGGHVPEWAGRFTPASGALANWGGDGYRSLKGMASNLSLIGGDQASALDIYSFGTKQHHPLGTMGMARDGRIYRFGSAGGADLVEGNIVQSAAPIANHLALTSAAQAIGDGFPTPIAVTPGNTAGAANLYAEGMLNVDTTPSNGYQFSISGHAAITASTLFNLYLYPDDRLVKAFTSATRYGLLHNPWKTVIIAATTVTAPVCGGAVINITANTVAENFGWLQTRGPFPGLINGTPGVGIGLVSSATTAGALDVAAVAAEINVRIIAIARQVCVSTKNNSVFLKID